MLFFWPRENVELGGGGKGEFHWSKMTPLTRINAAPIPSLQPLKHFLDKFLSSLGGPGRILETLIQQMKKSRAPPEVNDPYFDWHDDFMMQPHQKKCANIPTSPHSTENIICNVKKRKENKLFLEGAPKPSKSRRRIQSLKHWHSHIAKKL